MKNNLLYRFIILSLLVASCAREQPGETAVPETNDAPPQETVTTESTPRPVPQVQGLGLAAPGGIFYIAGIDPGFMGVYLPSSYITALKATRNHCLSLHLNSGSHHDVLAVIENMIYSNLGWHDQYAVRAAEGDLFRFIETEDGRVIIDTNGYVYKKIGDNPHAYHAIARDFVAGIVLRELLNTHTEIRIADGIATIPMLYPVTGEDTFFINLNTNFFERGLNLLLASTNADNRFSLALLIDENGHHFYLLERDTSDFFIWERTRIVLSIP